MVGQTKFLPGSRVICRLYGVPVGNGQVLPCITEYVAGPWVHVQLDSGKVGLFRSVDLDLTLTQQIANTLKG